MALLVQSGWDENTVEAMRPQFETCPECKRKHNLLSDGRENISMGEIGSTIK